MKVDTAAFDHEAIYDLEKKAIFTHIVANKDTVIATMEGKNVLSLKAGEKVFMEMSRKFDAAIVENLASKAGLKLGRTWTNSDKYHLVVELTLQ